MNSKQEGKFGMNNASINHLEDNREIWKNNPAFGDAFTIYKEKHELISEIVKEKARKIAGVFTSKKKKKTLLADLGLSMAGSLKAYASKTGNDTLKAAMTFSRSELKNMRDNKLGPVCTNILDSLKQYSMEMASYDISGEMIDNFGKSIAEHKVATSYARNATSSRKSLGKSLAELLDEMDAYVKDQIDSVILRYSTTHPLFYDEYKNNRTVIDSKTSSTQFAGIITDSVTGDPLKKVLVSVQDTAYLTNAKKDGKYKLRVPKNGTYILVFEFVGYETVIITEAELKLGKTTEVNVVMKRSS